MSQNSSWKPILITDETFIPTLFKDTVYNNFGNIDDMKFAITAKTLGELEKLVVQNPISMWEITNFKKKRIWDLFLLWNKLGGMHSLIGNYIVIKNNDRIIDIFDMKWNSLKEYNPWLMWIDDEKCYFVNIDGKVCTMEFWWRKYRENLKSITPIHNSDEDSDKLSFVFEDIIKYGKATHAIQLSDKNDPLTNPFGFQNFITLQLKNSLRDPNYFNPIWYRDLNSKKWFILHDDPKEITLWNKIYIKSKDESNNNIYINKTTLEIEDVTHLDTPEIDPTQNIVPIDSKPNKKWLLAKIFWKQTTK